MLPAIKDTTIIASIMYANNEIGTIEPIKELGAAAHSKGVIFHTDAVQAFAHIPVNVKDMNIDMLSASGHKFHGPKGTGFLYISNSVKIGSFIHGGSQERSRRAGTLNVPGIIGMAEAARLEVMNMEKNMEYCIWHERLYHRKSTQQIFHMQYLMETDIKDFLATYI